MKKIMYLMNVPWSWIKQRPHFIAEELSKSFEIDIFYKKAFAKNRMVANKNHDIYLIELFRLPFERYYIINKISSKIIANQINKKIKQYEVIWLSDPKWFFDIHKKIKPSQKLIYDCMDDMLEFPSIKRNSNQLRIYGECERELIRRADIVFVSSEYLKNKLLERYSIHETKKIHVVNNGIKDTIVENEIDGIFDGNYFKQNGRKRITYIGTISEWFDFNIVLESLKEFENIEYYLFGPKEVKIPNHERLNYLGVIEHDEIFSIMRQSDLLVMPFVLNELIYSVNPVKLYEYIFSLTPTLSIKYKETEKFQEYIYLYQNKDEYLKCIEKIIEDKDILRVSKEQAIRFIKENTWEQRTENIINIIKEKSL